MYSTLITVAELSQTIGAADLRIVDCRFDLSALSAGRDDYRLGHIPGAVYADVEQDLSGPPTTDHGRHPLPPPARMIEKFSHLGISNRDQVVIYDDAGGMFAARPWWMLRYLGHEAVAVLDGGWRAWVASGAAIEAGENSVEKAEFSGRERRSQLVTIDEIDNPEDLIDARDPQRYRGEVEPLDPRAGHIPGARNHFFKDNLNSEGLFLTRPELKQAFTTTLGKLPDSTAVHYCGSGVSACHNILAQTHAGLGQPRLYCGSWSEWCADPERPIAVGEG